MSKNIMLHQFIKTVNEKSANTSRIAVPKDQAIAARDFIESKLEAAAKGGSAKGSGPKIKHHTPEAAAERERVRLYRERLKRGEITPKAKAKTTKTPRS